MMGALDRRRAAFMVATDTWARSMMTPSRFISLTTLCMDTAAEASKAALSTLVFARPSGARRSSPDKSGHWAWDWAGYRAGPGACELFGDGG